MRRRWRLFPKYALLIVSVVGSMLVASGVIGVYFSWRETEANLVALQVEKAESAATRIEQYIVDIAQQISWTGLPPASADGDALEERRFEYIKLLKQVQAITEVAWIDSSGHEQLRISRLAMNTIRGGADLSQEAKFREASADRIYYGPVYFRKGTEPYMTIARPAGGGVTAVEVNLKFVWDVVSRIRIGEAGRAYVIDAEGSLIAHPDISLVLRKTDLSLLPQVVALRRPDAKAPPRARGIGGDPVLSAHAAIGTLHWTVFVESPEAEAFAPLYASILRAGLLLGAGLLLSMVASYFVARALVRPLQALQEGAARIGAGELDRRIEVKTGDELESVAEQFNKMGAALKESYADLEGKVEARTVELSEALEQQTATAEILRVISSSPDDVQPVFDAIAKRSRLLCSADSSAVRLPEGESLVARARDWSERAIALRLGGLEVVPIRRTSITGRAFLDGQLIHIEDVQTQVDHEYPDVRDMARKNKFRTVLVVPMLRDGRSIGTLSLFRYDVRPFAPAEIALVKTFADQAVIAIENVRLFNETREALERQTATANVLKVLSQSPTDVQPVFDAILESALALCGARMGGVARFDGELVHLAAFRGSSAEGSAKMRAAFPMKPSAGSILARAVAARAPVQIYDVLEDPDYALKDVAVELGLRGNLGVPMIRDGEVVGSIGVCREEPSVFPEKHVRLLQTFADQAVIAIENVRLFNETRDALRKVEQRTRELSEALDYQVAISDVLRVISQSPNDVAPVFEAILDCATRLFGSAVAAVYRYRDGLVELVATRNWPDEAVELAHSLYPAPPSKALLAGRVILSAQAFSVDDALIDPSYNQAFAQAGAWRRVAGAPMLKDGAPIGAILVGWPEAGETPQRQIDLFKTFADQAVIAIENVRLMNETKEALEQQTATAEILRVISSSPTDVQPVFDAIAERAMVLCGGNLGAATRFDGELVHLVSYRGTSARGEATMRAAFPMPASRGTSNGRAIVERTPIQIPDVRLDPEFELKDAAALSGWTSALAVPLLHEGRAIGSISALRAEPGPFPEKSVALLETFARQAVLAIENVRLFNETKESLERQTTTAEILKVIASSPADVQPVFDAIASSSNRLIAGLSAAVFLIIDDTLHLRAFTPISEEADEMLKSSFPLPLDAYPAGGLVRQGIVAQMTDVEIDWATRPKLVAMARKRGFRSLVWSPLMREGVAVGMISVTRVEPGSFAPHHVELLQTFADQAVIAIENVRLFNETKEALERQTATAEILRVISGSITDTQPVFDAIVQSCRRLFGGKAVHLAMPRGDMIEDVAFAADAVGPKGVGFLKPWPLDRGSGAGTCILEARVIVVADTVEGAKQFSRMPDLAIALGYRSCLFVPLLKDGKALGSITILRETTGTFDDQEIALAQTFADQAVIAIENVRLFNETNEALERQTATAEVLKVISASPTDVQPVLNAVAERAGLLCKSEGSRVWLLVAGDKLRAMAEYGPSLGGEDELPLRRSSIVGRAFLERRLLHVEDVVPTMETEYPDVREMQARLGFRTVLAVPMLRDGQPIGVITLLRRWVQPFPEADVSLVRTFADQAVIAIENTRLFNETKEALERQTATAEILRVISASMTEAQPVFDVIAERAVHLTGARFGFVFRFDGEWIHVTSAYGMNQEGLDAARKAFPMRPGDAAVAARVVRDGVVANVGDILADPGVGPKTLELARLAGYRGVLAVPMLREREIVGAISVTRAEPGVFAEREVDLLKTFASQAVIAIENARLFNQTKEALEHQIATSEVLQAISNSVADTAPVFDKILAGCERLFQGNQLVIFLVDDQERLALGAIRGPDPERVERMRRIFPVPLAGTATEQAIRERRLVTFADVLADPDVPDGLRRVASQLGETYAVAIAPMLWEGEAIGSIMVGRLELRAFDEKEQRLLRTFADQAVIAIQNARLFNETKEALERQTATAEVLRVISNSVADSAPVFDKILESCQHLFEVEQMGVFLAGDDGLMHAAALRGSALAAFARSFPAPIEDTISARVMREGRPMHVPDAAALENPPPIVRNFIEVFGNHSWLGAPMLWEGRAIGTIGLLRQPPKPFTSEEIELLTTFADQAVIAIQNARLFNETKEALEQQTATAEVLQVISSSVADTQPVFDKILDSCERLFAATGLGIYLVDADGQLRKAGFRGAREKPERSLGGTFPRPLEGTVTERAIRERRVIHYPDVLAEPDAAAVSLRRIAKAGGNFSIAFAPMLWEGRGVGAIQVSREPPQPFSEKELALLKTFADQAVIAIQNSRLFDEIQAKSRELEQANKHKSEFLANMSHELRTPLNAIIGFSEVLSEKMFGEVNEKQLEYLLDIHTSGQHLLSLINDILDLSKIEAGRMELDLASTSLPMLLDNCTTLVRERASRQGLVLALEVEPGVDDWVADVRKLKQVVINLLSNAVKFTPAGGRVTLRARRLEHAIEIAVVDTGVGIAEDQQALVFEEFRQAGGDYLRKAEGTGLGLSLAKRFVELHGGTMRVESKLGQGSTFAFILPERVVEAV